MWFNFRSKSIFAQLKRKRNTHKFAVYKFNENILCTSGERKDLCETKISSCDEIERNTHCVSFFLFCWVFFLCVYLLLLLVVLLLLLLLLWSTSLNVVKKGATKATLSWRKSAIFTRDDKKKVTRKMDYVYCGSDTGGRPDDIITLTSKRFEVLSAACLLYNANKMFYFNLLFQCTMPRMATKHIQHRISPHSICAKRCRNTWRWARYWPTVAIHLVCPPYDSIRTKNCFGWEMKE